MPSQYNGVATALAALLPTAKSIASSTNTSPIVLTTSSPHGCETGDSIEVFSHLVNTAANGQWEVLVTGASTLKLVGSTGNGVGGATGSIHNQGFGSDIQIPSAGDPRQIAGIAVALEALADRTVLLEQQLGWNLVTHHGGSHTINNGGLLELLSGSTLRCDPGMTMFGLLEVGDGTFGGISQISVSHFSSFQVEPGASLFLNAPSGGNVGQLFCDGLIDVRAGGLVKIENSAELDVLGGGKIEVKGSAGGGTLLFDDGSHLTGTTKCDNFLIHDGSTVTLDDTQWTIHANCSITDAATTTASGRTIQGSQTDDTTTTRTGPTIFSGDTGYRGLRNRLLVSADSNQSIDPWKYDLIQLTGAISANRNWTFSDPPNGERIETLVIMNVSELGTHSIQLKNSGGSNIVKFDGISSGANKWADIRWFAGPDVWDVTRHNAQDLGGDI